MRRPLLLDLFCGAGGAAKGYHDAGFDVIGVDIREQPNYPFRFYRADALEFVAVFGDLFDAIHASPPCQAYSAMTKGRWQDREHPDLIEATRQLLVAAGVPYVIENVPGAPLLDPIKLCGTMFDLGVRSTGAQLRRHRLFEAPWRSDSSPLPKCRHNSASAIGVYGGGQHPNRRRPATVGVWGGAGGSSTRDGLQHYGTEERREAMGIDWMTGKELSQSIPPAYTAFLGFQLMQIVNPSQEDEANVA